MVDGPSVVPEDGLLLQPLLPAGRSQVGPQLVDEELLVGSVAGTGSGERTFEIRVVLKGNNLFVVLF